MPCKYVSFHEQLTEDDKDEIPRAVRFVYMEISLKVRQRGPDVRGDDGYVRIKRSLSDVDAIWDLIHGDRTEIEAAVPILIREQMLRFERGGTEAYAVVPGWRRWNALTGQERVAKHRDAKREEVAGPRVQGILDGLQLASDLYGDEDVLELAKRIERKLAFEPRADKLDRRLVGSQVATAMREHAGKYPMATEAARVAYGERKVDWILADVRAGKVNPAAPGEARDPRAPATARELVEDAMESAARADREQERRAQRASARKPEDMKAVGAMFGEALKKIGGGPR